MTERLELFLPVCEAMEAAHQKLVIHRDLKPNNILVDHAGRPFVIDFGLAQVCDPSRRYRGREAVSGTPAYMSPEQISDAFGPVDQLSDLYTLGVILYELLAGQRPYNVPPHGSWESLRHAITSVTPPKLSQYHPECHGDLEAMVDRTLAKYPADRYASVAALHRDIRRYLQKIERIEIEAAVKLEALRQSETATDQPSQNRILDMARSHRLSRRLQSLGVRKLGVTFSGAVMILCMLWWGYPYLKIRHGDLILWQASHEEDVMRAVGVYRSTAKSMTGEFWRKQRALVFNRLGRIYAARRFSRYAMQFYETALQEDSRIAVIHANKAFLLEEIAEQKAYRSGDMQRFQEVQNLYETALRLDAHDMFTKTLRDGVSRRLRMARDRGEVEKLLTAPQMCIQPQRFDQGSPSETLTVGFYTAQRHGSFATRAGEGEVLLQRLIQVLQDHGRIIVRDEAIRDDCFMVHCLAIYRIDRFPKDMIHQQVLHMTLIDTETGERRAEGTVEWQHGKLEGVAEKLVEHLMPQLERHYPSRQQGHSGRRGR